MDRRGFLKAIASGTAMLMLPSLAVEAAPIAEDAFFPLTVDGLTHWMEDRFITSMGEARAFYELPIAEAVRRYGRIDVDKDSDLVRFNYLTLAIATEGDDPVKAEERLTFEMIQRLQELKADQHLVWRVKPQFASDEVIEFGDTWMTKEEIEDRVDLPRFNHGKAQETEWSKKQDAWWMERYWRMTPKETAERPPIRIPEGVEHDFATDSLRYVKRKYTLNKLRMRVVFPNALNENFAENFYAQREGEMTIRI